MLYRVIAKMKQNDTCASRASFVTKRSRQRTTDDEKLRIFVPLLNVTLAHDACNEASERARGIGYRCESTPAKGAVQSEDARGGNVAQVHDRPLPNSPPLPLLPSPCPSHFLSLSLSLSLSLFHRSPALLASYSSSRRVGQFLLFRNAGSFLGLGTSFPLIRAPLAISDRAVRCIIGAQAR